MISLITVGVVLSGCINSTNNNDSQKSIVLDDALFQSAPRDTSTNIITIKLEDGLLQINVTFSGGCEKHVFDLIGMTSFMESNPVQVNVVLSHNNTDPCDSIVNESLTFDLSPLKELWQQYYHSDSGTIIIWFEGWEESILYEF